MKERLFFDNMKRFASVMACVLMIVGCVDVRYVVKIPRTSNNLAAYRECQRILAMAGYDKDRSLNLMNGCIKSLEGVETIRAGEREEFERIYPGPECQQVEALSTEYSEITYFFFLCNAVRPN